MNSLQSKHSCSPSLFQDSWKVTILLAFVGLLSVTFSCSEDDTPIDEPILKGIITSYNEFGAAMFDFETVVRRGPGNLKRMFTPESVTLHGNVSFDGAEPDYPTAQS